MVYHAGDAVDVSGLTERQLMLLLSVRKIIYQPPRKKTATQNNVLQ